MRKVNFIPGRWGQGYIMHQQRILLLKKLLLDDYPGAAAAYSLRKLRTDYTGAAIRVRESATNTEADIGFTSSGALDTTALLAHTGANNGFVVTWYDQSGNARNATQSTAANQPQIVASGSVVTDGAKPTLSMNGSSHFMRLTSNFSTFNNISCITVANPTAYSTSNQNGRFFNLKDGTNDIQALHDNATGKMAMYNNQWQTTTGTTFEPSLTTRALLFNIYFTTSNQYNKNGVTITATGTAGVSVSGSQSTLFQHANLLSTTYYYGLAQEMIFYNSDQSSNRTAIESNINAHYNIYP